MTIAEVSNKYNIPTDTLRYWEKIGLIPTVNRSKGGIRRYNETDIKWVEFIKCMRGAGINIETLLEYVNLCQQDDETANKRKQLLIEARESIANQMAEMQKSLDLMDYKIKFYDTVMLAAEKELGQKEKKG